MSNLPEPSPAQKLAAELARLPHEKAVEILESLSVVDMAALACDWRGCWARPQQLIDLGACVSHGFLSARRVGKTRADIECVVEEATSGRAMRIGFCAQNLDKTLEVLVFGDCGLIACSPPWAKARYELGRVIWPNGAQAFPFTPEVPGAIRGPGVHLFLASELQSWPAATMFEAWFNAMLMTSLGAARMLWEATPKKGHALLSMLLKRAAEDPAKHVVKTGRIEDNSANLSASAIATLRKDLEGTQRGREELDGIFSESDEEALWRSEWIDKNKRPMPDPDTLVRRVIALDPAIGTKEDSDSSGVADVGMDRSGQCYPIADLTGKHAGLALADLAISRYIAGRCDLLLIETNRGGSWGVELLRVAAEKHGVRIEVVAKDWKPRRIPGIVHVREVHSKGSKGERATPVAGYYERGKVSHVNGAALDELERLMTTWVPPAAGTRAGGRRSPDALDAVVMAIVELAGLKADGEPDHAASFKGLEAVHREIVKPQGPAPNLAALFPASGGWGRKL